MNDYYYFCYLLSSFVLIIYIQSRLLITRKINNNETKKFNMSKILQGFKIQS